MEAQRALLDSLMGFNRDGDRPDDDPQLDFRHPRVCKPYLCGLCPRELFQNTRLDAGACALIHSPSIRSAYQEEAKRDFGYERELTNELSRLLSDVERKIAKAQRRLVDDNGDTCPDKAQSQSQSRSDAKDVDVNQKLRVCDVCGAFLSIFDSERRLADHFGGKVHVGYVQIRRKLKELTDKTQQQEKEKEKKVERTRRSVSRSRRRDERPRSRRDDGDRERRRGRRRSRSRERRRSSRDRHRRRSESSSRSRSRSRSRKRQRSRRR